MNRERWAQIEDLGARAAELEGPAREALLAEACAGDPELRREIEGLLQQLDDGEAFGRHPCLALPGRCRARGSPRAHRGLRRRGRARAGRHGHGLQGVRQGDGFVQRVALKVVQARMDSGELVRRFRTERKILAGLEHPGIARFIEGGTTADGRPYVAMEFVEGTRINDYCRLEQLGLESRLALFDQVCEAVQYAHENLVVHRDLKPSNILVTGDGKPKLLDFGIGKLLEAEDDGDQTRTGQLPLTPRFAAPEQLQGGPITTATDVYALGILLYQLLTGVHPYAGSGSSLMQMREAALTGEVTRPSDRTRVRDEPASVGPSPEAQAAEVRWGRRLRGDLDSITLKALRKEPERRYPTVAALRDDLRRWREGLPVEARPDSAAYRLRRFVGRHRVPVAAATLAFLGVSASAVLAGVQYRRAQREAAQARFERDRAQGVIGFLTGLFEWADPNRARGADVTARELLAAGTARVDSVFGGDPDLQAELYGTIAPVYTLLGLHEEAEAVARSALDASAGSDDVDLRARQMIDLGRALHGQTRYDEAQDVFRTAVELSQGAVEPLTRARALALLGAANAERNLEPEETRKLLETSLGIYEEQGARGEPDATVPMQALAIVHTRAGRAEEAIPLYAEALAIIEREFGRQHTRAAAILSSMGALQLRLGNHQAAIDDLEEALEIRRSLYGDDHAAMGTSWFNVAQAYYEAGRLADGRGAYERALAIRVPMLGENHVSVANTRYNFGYSLARHDHDDEAAVEQLERAAAAYRAIGGEAYPTLDGVTVELAAALGRLGRWEQAETRLLERYRWAESQGADTEALRDALVELYEGWGKPERAAPFRTPPG